MGVTEGKHVSEVSRRQNILVPKVTMWMDKREELFKVKNFEK